MYQHHRWTVDSMSALAATHRVADWDSLTYTRMQALHRHITYHAKATTQKLRKYHAYRHIIYHAKATQIAMC
jgi:hypothetical protein